jgi:hypothetical protein
MTGVQPTGERMRINSVLCLNPVTGYLNESPVARAEVTYILQSFAGTQTVKLLIFDYLICTHAHTE